VETQLKQRLTGAVILVLIGALLVPELLTGPRSREPGGAGVSSDAPLAPAAGDGAMRSHEITIGDEPAPSPAPVPAPAPAPAPLPSAPAPAAEPVARPAVVAPRSAVAARAPATPPTAAAPRPTAGAGYVVQVGSFSSRPAADRLVSDLRRRGFEGTVSTVQTAGRTLYRVRVGPARDRAAAAALASRLKGAGFAGSVVPSA
jgi:cell division septation protein DedD